MGMFDLIEVTAWAGLTVFCYILCADHILSFLSVYLVYTLSLVFMHPFLLSLVSFCVKYLFWSGLYI
jgi:hypothetical protein